jgi:hypothetical protein
LQAEPGITSEAINTDEALSSAIGTPPPAVNEFTHDHRTEFDTEFSNTVCPHEKCLEFLDAPSSSNHRSCSRRSNRCHHRAKTEVHRATRGRHTSSNNFIDAERRPPTKYSTQRAEDAIEWARALPKDHPVRTRSCGGLKESSRSPRSVTEDELS